LQIASLDEDLQLPLKALHCKVVNSCLVSKDIGANGFSLLPFAF
jgi:hypothetical protein